MNSNPPVIFIHGFIGTFDVKAFDAQHAAPHLLGYGEYRDTAFDRISLPAQVAHLHASIDATFGATAVDLVGHSVGGAIAMLFAHTYPERVRRIVNVEGNFTLDDAFWSASVGRMTPGEAEAMLAGFRANPPEWLRGSIADATPQLAEAAARWLDYQPASTLRAMGQSVVTVTGSADYLRALEQVVERHPVYLLSGERSHEGWNVPRWAVEKSAGRETLERCGHLMMVEDPAAFSAAIRRFLGHASA